MHNAYLDSQRESEASFFHYDRGLWIMANGSLTFDEAVETWLLRAHGVMRRHMSAKYGVDPRRLYEVWSGIDHPNSRDAAIAEFRRQFPDREYQHLFEWHVQQREVRLISNQLDLFER